MIFLKVKTVWTERQLHTSVLKHTKTSKIETQGWEQFGGSFGTSSVNTDLPRWLLLRRVCDPHRREVCPGG